MTIIRYTSHLYERVQQFLLKHEKYCVYLVEEFIKERPQFHLLCKKGNIAGIISINDGGQIKHCLPFKTREEIAEAGNLLISFFNGNQNFHIFSIVGERSGTELLKTALNVSYGIKESVFNEYVLMENTSLQVEKSDVPEKMSFPPESVLIRKCNGEDAEILFPLQKNYELEEVYTDHSRFKSAVCLFNLEKRLKNSHQLALFIEGKPVAKGGSNAAGFNYVQLGGIFTGKEFRGQGFARKIVEKLINDFGKKGKKCVLFVKIANEAAIGLYRNCGFKEIGPFAIAYY